MSAKTIKTALGLLQDDPESEEAWQELRGEVQRDPGMAADELRKLLEAARRAHEARREYGAVARLLDIEADAAEGTARQVELLGDLARILDEELLDDERANAVYDRLLTLRTDDTAAAEAKERSQAKRAKWRELVDRYLQEASHTGDPAFRSSLLVGAAEATYRFGRRDSGKEAVDRIVQLLRDALQLDPKNRRAEMLLERTLRDEERWDELARAMERFATDVPQRDEKISAWVRLGRVYRQKLDSRERAAAAYERVLDLAPGHGEASSFLSDYFTSSQMWDHLIAMYEEQLAAGVLRGKEEEFGATLQIAMVHWRMRGRAEAAEPWFEKLRKLDPSHPGMLTFFREWCSARGESQRLTTILTDAQRTLSDGAARSGLVAEVARLAEEGANAQKAIEQWRALLRQDPRNTEARDALKRLYRQTASWSALTDLLRQELERIPGDDVPGRLIVLREIASIYRSHVKSDSALVTVLTQIVQLDPTDVVSLRELARVYEALQRWRDLLGTQARQADLETDVSTKVELWRAVGRRWLDQFSNVQNAVEAFEKLRALEPSDKEAITRLRELYVKRRAYKPLYDLLGEQTETMPSGPERRELWMEMAKLAAERLDMGPQSAVLYKRVLDEDPRSAVALDALEKQAERDKDFATVAEALERRSQLTSDPTARLAVLQKLGTVYSERLHDSPMAMSAWRRVLSLQPGHAKALRVLRDSYLGIGDFDGLTELYAQNGDWESLAEVLSGAADKATEPALKVDLSFRCAQIYAAELHAPERAFRAYERVLSVVPDDARAAAALAPLYEKDEKWGRLPALYEILLGHATALQDKLDLLDKLVQVTGQQLQDRATSFRWATRTYELAPERPGALETFEKAAQFSDQWTGFVDAVSNRLQALDASVVGAVRPKKKKKKDSDNAGAAKNEERRALRAKLAEVYAAQLGRMDDAVQIYRALVEEDETDDAAVQTLDRILRESDRRDDLRWLFDVRVERANTALKIELLSDWAMLEEEAFGAPEQAAELYRRTLQVVPHHGGALRALARLLRARGDAEGAAEVIAMDRDQREGADRAAREIELAKLYVDPLRRYVDALAACERALRLTPNDPRAMAVVEQLLPVPETRARAAAILERAYDETGASRPQADVLEVLVATTAARDDRVALYGRLADVHERKLGNPDAAFEVIARAASEYPTDLALWDRLAVLAAKTGRVQGLVDAIVAVVPPDGPTGLPEHVELDLAERVATLFDEKLDDADRAGPYLERMLARQPANERAFQRLKQILTMREQWAELGHLYERAVGAAVDPRRRAELLAEVALVVEEIIGDRPKAIEYYERILEIDPANEQAIRSLDTLCEAEQRWERLSQLLERRLQGTRGDDRLDLQQRLGTLLFTRMGNPTGALAYFEEVLRERPSATEARQLVEKILDVPELRSRAAIVLESVYTSRDDVPELVRVLEIHLEFANEVAERRDLLRRVAQLRDERLRDDAGALEAFARLLPLDPDDAGARHRTLEIARRLFAYERAAGVLLTTAGAATAPMPRADILMDVARIYESHLGEPSRAEAIYRQVLTLAPEDASIALPACRSLERIYGRGDSRQLCEILRIEVGLEDDATARRDLRGRLGELCETVLDDPRGAIEAWRTRLDEDPTDAQALAALDRLYERSGSWRELVDVLRTRERMTDGTAARRELLVRVATTLADKLSDADEAISAYRAVIDEFGADRGSLSALASLYQHTARWRELAETLEADMALADSPADKLALLARLGDVRQARLEDTPAAIDAYRRALVLEPSNVRARTALEKMLDEPSAQKEVASILRPLYEADGLYDQLLRVLEIEAEYSDSAGDRLATIARSVDVAEGPLGAPARAFSYAARGLRDAVAEPELPAWIDRVERLAARSDKYAELVQLLRSAVDEIADANLELEVTLRIADLARQRLADPGLAKQYYVHALELRGDERRALVALESLYEEVGEHSALLEIVKRRADLADSDAIRRQLLFKQARLSDERIGDAHAAIAVYEQILDMGLDPEAIAALQRLYAREGRWDDLVALYDRQIVAPGVSNERKATLHHALGEVLEKGTHEYERAFDEYAAALAIDPKHQDTIGSLERLMGQRDHAARAATMLEPVYIGRLDWRRVMATLEARLAVSQEPHERKQLLRRLSKLHEEQEENYAAALDTTALLLGEEPTDESTWSELERLARVANAQGRLAEAYAAELEKITADEPATAKLARRTGELFEAQNDIDRALVFYRRAHAFEPEDEVSFSAIDRLLKNANRPAERVKLYRDSLDYENDPRERLAALQTIARIQETELRDDTGAIDTYRAALEIDDGDHAVLDALSTLYERGGRWHDLAEFTRRRAEQSAFPEDEARFRTALAKLLIHKLNETAAGLDELQAVVDVTATQRGGPGAETIAELESLLRSDQFKSRAIDILRPIYEGADDWRRLIALNEERLAIAADDGERIAIWRENAFLWERRGKDLRKAFDSIREAWTLDPEDGEAREYLDRIGASTGRWDDLARAYETSIARSDGGTKRELLAALAHLHDRRRDDPRRALDAWERLFALDETDLQPLEEMDALATLLSDWRTLVRVLLRKAELVSDDESRASTWRRIGEARHDMLDDTDGAIAAFERAFELEPSNAATVDQLISLHERKKDASRLVDLYRRRVELCADGEDELRFALLVSAASSYETDLANRRDAIECLVQALVVKPGDSQVLRKLDALYTQEHLWPELLENLRLQTEASTDKTVRLALKKRVAALYAVDLQDPQSALETYRDILQSTFDEESVAALRAIGESRDDLRLDAADVLEPALVKAGRHADVAAVLELRLRAQTEPEERTRTLRSLASVAESSLGDLERAQSALIRALAEDPGDAALHSEIERLAGRAGTPGWQRYADALQERAATVFEASVAGDLYIRLGRAAEAKLDDPRRAANAYASAAERLGDDPSVLSALDRLLERLGEKRRLAEVIERRIAAESDARAQADLAFRLGTLQLRSFNQKAESLASFRQALERVPEHTESQEALASLLDDDALFDEAFDALETVYRTTGRTQDVAQLYERRVARARTTRERTRASLELAHVLETTVGDRSRAQRAVQAALSADPGEEEALAELERLATANSGWADATATLAASLEAVNDLPAATRMDLWVRLAGWYRDRLADARLAEDAYTKGLLIDPENLDVLRALEELRRAPGRERELVQTLRTRARLETDSATKRELLREAKTLAESPVADRELAEATLRDLISEDERDLWALEELTRLRSAAGDEAEVVKLLLRRSEIVDDAKVAGSLQHEAAQVLVQKLDDVPRATALYEEILDTDPDDAKAASALRDLYVRAGRDRDLSKLLLRLIDGATGSRRTELRLELARLQADRFKAPEDAIETLVAALDDEPSHADTVLLLSDLYEQTGRDGELAELLKAQLEAARNRQDIPAELALLVRLAEVQERRLGDVSGAQQAYEQVLLRNPYHRAALEAVARIAERRADWDRAANALSRLLDFATEPSGVAWALRLAEARDKSGDSSAVEDALQRGLKLEESNVSLRTMLRVRWERAGKWQELADLLVGDAELVKASTNHDSDVQAVAEPQTAAVGLVANRVPPPTAAPSVRNSVAEKVALLKTAAQIHLARLHRPDQAIPVLERAAQLVPHDRELLLTLCDAYNAAQRGRDAAQVLEKVIASFGTRRTKEVALYHHRLARALTQLGDKNVALTQLDLAFKIDPSSVGVLRDLGVLAFETNDLERAQRTFRALLLQRLDSNAGISKGEVFCYLGEISAKQGDKAKALQMFERAIENDPALERARNKLSELKG